MLIWPGVVHRNLPSNNHLVHARRRAARAPVLPSCVVLPTAIASRVTMNAVGHAERAVLAPCRCAPYRDLRGTVGRHCTSVPTIQRVFERRSLRHHADPIPLERMTVLLPENWPVCGGVFLAVNDCARRIRLNDRAHRVQFRLQGFGKKSVTRPLIVAVVSAFDNKRHAFPLVGVLLAGRCARTCPRS